MLVTHAQEQARTTTIQTAAPRAAPATMTALAAVDFIASLAQPKAESSFTDVLPERMTCAQMQELAARYNDGPSYESEAVQAYGRGVGRRLDQVKEALG